MIVRVPTLARMRDLLRLGLFTSLYHCGRTFERAATLFFYAAAGTLRLADLRAVIQRTATARHVIQKRALEPTIYTGGIETFELPGRFDAFIFSWFCYSYIQQSKTRIRVLGRLREHLNPGGRILISYNPGEARPRHLPIRLTQLVAWLCRLDWHPEYGDHLSILGRRTLHYEHQFTPEKLEGEARAAGLSVEFHETAEESRAVLVA